MDPETIDKKLWECLNFYGDVHDAPSRQRQQEFLAMKRELAALIGISQESDFREIVNTAGRVIGELTEEARLDDHRRWLDRFNPQHRRNWERQLQENRDGAKCEMLVRMLLEENGNQVVPNADLSGRAKAPDFRCEQRGQRFLVEVTCIDSTRATRATSLPPKPSPMSKAYAFGDINQTIFEKLTDKLSQCKDLAHPVLVAIGTLHFQASALTFEERFVRNLLTGTEYITANLERTEKAFISTRLEHAAFLRQDALTGEIVPIHTTVSGLLLCGFGCEPATLHGLLHPRPIHPFDRILLGKIPFMRLAAGYEEGPLKIEAV